LINKRQKECKKVDLLDADAIISITVKQRAKHMLTLSQKSEVYERVDHFINVANAEYGHSMEGPYVRFDKRGTCGGTADSQLMELNFNAGLMLDNWDEYMNQVIPHEVAHLVKATWWLLEAGYARLWSRARSLSQHGHFKI